MDVPDSLGDVRDRVADPFELVGDVVERQEVPQVARDGRLGRDGANDVVEPSACMALISTSPSITLSAIAASCVSSASTVKTDPLLDERGHPEERLP